MRTLVNYEINVSLSLCYCRAAVPNHSGAEPLDYICQVAVTPRIKLQNYLINYELLLL